MRKTRAETEISKLRILLAAEEEFCKRGFASANIDSIARAVGMTKGAVFWHYKSKSELFTAVVRRATERVRTIFREAFSSDLPVMEKVREVIRQVRKDRAFGILMLLTDAGNTRRMPKDVLGECGREIGGVFRDGARYLEEAKERGELRPDTDIRDILVSITLLMSGFARIRDLKSILAPIRDRIESESVIDSLFAGLSSFQSTS